MNQMPLIRAPDADTVSRHDRAVGERIRALRKKNRISLQDLASRSGLSIGYLSQIERGISSASVRALAIIANGIGAGFDALFMADAQAGGDVDAFAFTAAERRNLGFWRDGIEKDLLTPGDGQNLNLYLVNLAPGGCSGEAAYTHDGWEAGYVIAGEFELTVDGQPRILQSGDAFRFRSNRPHRWRNTRLAPCQIIWVLSH